MHVHFTLAERRQLVGGQEEVAIAPGRLPAALRSAISVEVNDEAALEGTGAFDVQRRGALGGIAGRRDAGVDATPSGAKTASGSSVIGSTTRSPRMPCALRTRPTMMSCVVSTSIVIRRGSEASGSTVDTAESARRRPRDHE